jgi:single-strand DNA-binding protein
MLNLNHVLLGGNLTRDAVVRFLANENAVANFTLAINRKFKSGTEMKEEPTFIDCECWGRTAELAGQYLTKGRNVFVEGRLKLEAWQDKDGVKRTKLKAVIESLQFIGGNKPTETNTNTTKEPISPTADTQPLPPVAIDKPPF